MQSSKKRVKQFDLKLVGLFLLQETHSTTDFGKKWKDDFGGDLHFGVIHLVRAQNSPKN